MKTAFDPRHQKRREAIKLLFANTFLTQANLPDLVKHVLENKEAIDAKITASAPSWPISDLNRIDLAVLRLAVYELDQGLTPAKVIIDEAVELGKEFGSDNSGSFINGVLGTIYKDGQSKKSI